MVSHLGLTGLFVVLVLAASNSIVRAQDCPSTTWIYSGRTSDWFNPGNWSNCIPNSTNDAYINNGGVAQIHGSNVFAETQSLTLGNNQGESGGVTVYDSAILKISCVTDSCPGPIYIGNQGSGSLSIGSGGLVISKYGYIAEPTNSNGTVTVAYGTVWLLMDSPYPPINNFGAGIFVGCTATSNGVGGTATVSVGGTIAVHNRPSPNYDGAASVILGLSGTLTGNGSLDLHDGTTALSKTATIYGTLAPSNGALTISGKLNLRPSANTVCHVTPQGGMLVGDKVYVQQSSDDGDAMLAGRLTVVLTGTFTEGMAPATLLHADGGRIGSFTSYSFISPNPLGCLAPVITYDAHNVILSLVSTCQEDELDP